MFKKQEIELKEVFEQLEKSVRFEQIVKGRHGANLIDYYNELVPLVRTTTEYILPNQNFAEIHKTIMREIKKVSEIGGLFFNNAMIEMYDNSYKRMKFHTDIALDLQDDTYICIYSCYNNINTTNLRKLIVKNKETGEITKFLMEHNTFILFPKSINKKYVHKIVLEQSNKKNINDDTKWIGITFRVSKTFIKFIDNEPYFINNNIKLVLSTEQEKIELMRYKGNENNNIEFTYPQINYTISLGDLIPINK